MTSTKSKEPRWTPLFMEQFATEWLKHDILLHNGRLSPHTAGLSERKLKRRQRMARREMYTALGISLHRSWQKYFLEKLRKMLSKLAVSVRARSGEQLLAAAPPWVRAFNRRVPVVPEVVKAIVEKEDISPEGERAQLLLCILRAMWGALQGAPGVGGAPSWGAPWGRALHAASKQGPFPMGVVMSTWNSVKKVSMKKLRLLQEAGDRVFTLPPAAALTEADWLAAQMVLLYGGGTLCNETTLKDYDQLSTLTTLFSLVQLHALDAWLAAAPAPDMERRWLAATQAYIDRGYCSVCVVLQRRWYELVCMTRARLAAALRAPAPLPPMCRAVATRFPALVTGALPAWRELLHCGRVYASGGGPPMPSPAPAPSMPPIEELQIDTRSYEDDLMIIEEDIETIDLADLDSSDETDRLIIDERQKMDDIEQANKGASHKLLENKYGKRTYANYKNRRVGNVDLLDETVDTDTSRSEEIVSLKTETDLQDKRHESMENVNETDHNYSAHEVTDKSSMVTETPSIDSCPEPSSVLLLEQFDPSNISTEADIIFSDDEDDCCIKEPLNPSNDENVDSQTICKESDMTRIQDEQTDVVKDHNVNLSNSKNDEVANSAVNIDTDSSDHETTPNIVESDKETLPTANKMEVKLVFPLKKHTLPKSFMDNFGVFRRELECFDRDGTEIIPSESNTGKETDKTVTISDHTDKSIKSCKKEVSSDDEGSNLAIVENEKNKFVLPVHKRIGPRSFMNKLNISRRDNPSATSASEYSTSKETGETVSDPNDKGSVDTACKKEVSSEDEDSNLVIVANEENKLTTSTKNRIGPKSFMDKSSDSRRESLVFESGITAGTAWEYNTSKHIDETVSRNNKSSDKTACKKEVPSKDEDSNLVIAENEEHKAPLPTKNRIGPKSFMDKSNVSRRESLVFEPGFTAGTASKCSTSKEIDETVSSNDKNSVETACKKEVSSDDEDSNLVIAENEEHKAALPTKNRIGPKSFMDKSNIFRRESMVFEPGLTAETALEYNISKHIDETVGDNDKSSVDSIVLDTACKKEVPSEDEDSNLVIVEDEENKSTSLTKNRIGPKSFMDKLNVSGRESLVIIPDQTETTAPECSTSKEIDKTVVTSEDKDKSSDETLYRMEVSSDEDSNLVIVENEEQSQVKEECDIVVTETNVSSMGFYQENNETDDVRSKNLSAEIEATEHSNPKEYDQNTHNDDNTSLNQCSGRLSAANNVEIKKGEANINEELSLQDEDEHSNDSNELSEKGNPMSPATPKEESSNSRMDEDEDVDSKTATDDDTTGIGFDKLLMSAQIPLHRIDDLPSWKKHARVNSIDVSAAGLSRSVKCCEPRSWAVARRRAARGVSLATLCAPLSVRLQRLPLDIVEAYLRQLEDESRPRKKVELSDIEEVRRANRRLLTAQVKPLAVSDAAGQGSDAAGQMDLSGSDSGDDLGQLEQLIGNEAGNVLTPDKLKEVLKNARSAAKQGGGGAGGGASGGASGGRKFCCLARRHISYNRARQRLAARAGKHSLPKDMHGQTSGHAELQCSCCCIAALREEARGAERLAADLRALHNNLRHLAHTRRQQSASSVAPLPTAPPALADPVVKDIRERNKKRFAKKREQKKRKKKRTETQTTDDDNSDQEENEYDEWMRQRNLYAKYFTLTPTGNTKSSKPNNTIKVRPSVTDNTQPSPPKQPKLTTQINPVPSATSSVNSLLKQAHINNTALSNSRNNAVIVDQDSSDDTVIVYEDTINREENVENKNNHHHLSHKTSTAEHGLCSENKNNKTEKSNKEETVKEAATSSSQAENQNNLVQNTNRIDIRMEHSYMKTPPMAIERIKPKPKTNQLMIPILIKMVPQKPAPKTNERPETLQPTSSTSEKPSAEQTSTHNTESKISKQLPVKDKVTIAFVKLNPSVASDQNSKSHVIDLSQAEDVEKNYQNNGQTVVQNVHQIVEPSQSQSKVPTVRQVVDQSLANIGQSEIPNIKDEDPSEEPNLNHVVSQPQVLNESQSPITSIGPVVGQSSVLNIGQLKDPQEPNVPKVPKLKVSQVVISKSDGQALPTLVLHPATLEPTRTVAPTLQSNTVTTQPGIENFVQSPTINQTVNQGQILNRASVIQNPNIDQIRNQNIINTNQPILLSTNQPMPPSMDRPILPAINQPVLPEMNRLVLVPAGQSISSHVIHSIPETNQIMLLPTSQSMPSPINQSISPMNQPLLSATNQPILTSLNQPVLTPMNQPLLTSTNQIMLPATSQSIPSPIMQPLLSASNQPMLPGTNQHILMSASQSVRSPMNQPVLAATNHQILSTMNQPILSPMNQPRLPTPNQPIPMNQPRLPAMNQPIVPPVNQLEKHKVIQIGPTAVVEGVDVWNVPGNQPALKWLIATAQANPGRKFIKVLQSSCPGLTVMAACVANQQDPNHCSLQIIKQNSASMPNNQMIIQPSIDASFNQPGQTGQATTASNQMNQANQNQVSQMNQVTQINQVTQMNQASQINQVAQMNQFNQMNQVNQINQVTQMNQVKETTNQSPTPTVANINCTVTTNSSNNTQLLNNEPRVDQQQTIVDNTIELSDDDDENTKDTSEIGNIMISNITSLRHLPQSSNDNTPASTPTEDTVTKSPTHVPEDDSNDTDTMSRKHVWKTCYLARAPHQQVEELVRDMRAANVPLSDLQILVASGENLLMFSRRYLVITEFVRLHFNCKPTFWSFKPRVNMRQIVFPATDKYKRVKQIESIDNKVNKNDAKSSDDANKPVDGPVLKVKAFALLPGMENALTKNVKDDDEGKDMRKTERETYQLQVERRDIIYADQKCYKKLCDDPLIYAQLLSAVGTVSVLERCAEQGTPLYLFDTKEPRPGCSDLLEVVRRDTHFSSHRVVDLSCRGAPAAARELVALLNSGKDELENDRRRCMRKVAPVTLFTAGGRASGAGGPPEGGEVVNLDSDDDT